MKKKLLEQKIREYKTGDKRAFDAIYDMTYKAVYFRILYVVRDKMYAEDILHDAYLRAMEHLDSYREDTDFIAWLSRIGKNLALNFLEKKKREVQTDFQEEEYRFSAKEPEPPWLFSLAQKILSEEEYEILMLCQVSGYKRREVADMLSLPIGTVTWKNNEALKKLKKHLEKENKEVGI